MDTLEEQPAAPQPYALAQGEHRTQHVRLQSPCPEWAAQIVRQCSSISHGLRNEKQKAFLKCDRWQASLIAINSSALKRWLEEKTFRKREEISKIMPMSVLYKGHKLRTRNLILSFSSNSQGRRRALSSTDAEKYRAGPQPSSRSGQ